MLEARDLVVGVGVALAIEGALWGASPRAMRMMMRQLDTVSDTALRFVALGFLAAGVAIVWLVRGA